MTKDQAPKDRPARKRRYPERVTREEAAARAAQRAAKIVQDKGLRALDRLLVLLATAERTDQQAKVVARFIAGVSDGVRYPFDLTEFRLLTPALVEDCLAVVRLDLVSWQGAVDYIEGGRRVIDGIIERWGIALEQYLNAQVRLDILPAPSVTTKSE